MATPIENNTEGLQEILQRAQELPQAVNPDEFVKKTELPDAVDDALESKIVNNFTTTEEGFVADARALKKLTEISESSINFYEQYVQNVFCNNVYKRNGICNIAVNIILSETAKFTMYTDNVIATIPEGFRPIADQRLSTMWRSKKYLEIVVYPSGDISICPFDNIDGDKHMLTSFSLSYICEEV